MTPLELKEHVKNRLAAFAAGDLRTCAIDLLKLLGYHSAKTVELSPASAESFLGVFRSDRPFNSDRARIAEWLSVDLLIQVTDAEIRTGGGQASLIFEASKNIDSGCYQSYIFVAIKLSRLSYTRTVLAEITREVNRLFAMPAMLVFLHGDTLTLSVIDRRLSKRDVTRDVLEKVTLIKDVRITNPHRALIEILYDLSLNQLHDTYGFRDFEGLHAAWRKALDSSTLSKRFYKDIADWYFWAVGTVVFPIQPGTDAAVATATNVIRLLTRMIFVWFIKEKGLISADLFNARKLKEILKQLDSSSSSYYKAVLQNLFFATLNTEMSRPGLPRRFRSKTYGRGRDSHYMVHNVYRYEDYFRSPSGGLDLLSGIPFLNGGLLECLDHENGNGGVMRVDGFSDRLDNPLTVPNYLFFAEDPIHVDLNSEHGTSSKDYGVRGLLNILESYKFTIVENTPVEEEAALDPELLGHVFENLLAEYNPETRDTARKQTGSFYTPRTIVDYMVDQALIEALRDKLALALPPAADIGTVDNITQRLTQLLSYSPEPHRFTNIEVTHLIHAIDNLKVIDPACGSGAYPMACLHKLVHVLHKLDPENERWHEEQLARADRIDVPEARESAISEIEQAFQRNELDYFRKLFLIKNCLYGVDVQPTAIQITKLRFFISLAIDQTIDKNASNFGICPLPNLETKLVAANALFGVSGLDMPGQLRSTETYAKEAALRRVRRQHFGATSRTTKLKCQELDKLLRAELAASLRKDGFADKVVDDFSSWDPYTQTETVGFFDAEWMFGITTGFDIVIGNPPYGANIDDISPQLVGRYPTTTRGYRDIYKVFVELAFSSLARSNGVVAYITPNTFLRQPRYRDLKLYLSRYRIIILLDLGIGVFAQTVPTCIFVATYSPAGDSLLFADLTIDGKYSGDLGSRPAGIVTHASIFQNDPKHTQRPNDKIGLVELRWVLDFKDAGVNYQRVHVGLSQKGNSDLGQRLLYEGAQESREDEEYWKGVDIEEYWMSPSTNRYVRVSTARTTAPNERVILNRDYFARVPKILWRQTAQWPIVALDTFGVWFGRSIQAATINHEYSFIDLRYLLGVLNSSHVRSLYNARVHEQGRVFPQVKLEYMRSLIVPILSADRQEGIIALVDQALTIRQANSTTDISEIKKAIDELVDELYDA